MNMWIIAGRVTSAERKTTTNGKVWWKVSILAQPLKDGGKPAAANFTYWGENCPAQGSVAVASGIFSSWTGQSGDIKEEKTAFEIHEIKERAQPDQRQQPPQATRGYDRYQPVTAPAAPAAVTAAESATTTVAEAPEPPMDDIPF